MYVVLFYSELIIRSSAGPICPTSRSRVRSWFGYYGSGSMNVLVGRAWVLTNLIAIPAYESVNMTWRGTKIDHRWISDSCFTLVKLLNGHVIITSTLHCELCVKFWKGEQLINLWSSSFSSKSVLLVVLCLVITSYFEFNMCISFQVLSGLWHVSLLHSR